MIGQEIAQAQYLLKRLEAHQGKCGSLEETEGGITCTKCGLKMSKGTEVPKLEGKGFTIEYH